MPAAPPDRSDRDRRLAGWLAAAAAGDASAYEAFYDATIAAARTLARRLLRGADSDDLLADAYFEAWRQLARFDPARGSAMTWLLQIVHSRALDRLRRQPPTAETQVEAVADDGDPADRLWQREAGSRLDAALRELRPGERWLLGLAYFRDLSHRQIAAETGLPLGSVKSSLQRAQHKLRAALALLESPR